MNKIIYDKLVEIAKKESFITYQNLSNQCNLGLDMSDIDHRNELAHLLGDISLYEVKNNRPMLSVIVFREDINQPGNGFFEWASTLNLYNGSSSDVQKEKFFISELTKCYNYWKNHKINKS